MMQILRALVRMAFFAIVIGVVVIGGAAAVTLFYFNRELPSHKQLVDYIPSTGTKVYAADGSLMVELETEHRIPVPLAKVPPLLIHAVLAAEDRDFYNHKGVNPVAIFRAALADIGRYQKGQRPMGASTITQQVVRHFLLTNEVSIVRKIKEMLLAYRIENELSKDRIIEIYLNEIYFGAGAYGVAAAADTYFQKPLDKLTLAETAFIAALPKAPNNYNAARHAKAAQARRDWVLGSMAEIGWITQDQAKAATAEPLGVRIRDPEGNQNGYFAEEVRRELIGRFGEKAVYEGGMTVQTSYMPNYQKIAEAAFRNGLVDYDRRHGWRGPLAHLPNPQAAVAALPGMADPAGVASWKLAAVTAVEAGGARITLRDGSTGLIALQDMLWARRTSDDQRLGASVHRALDVVQPGDIVIVEGVRTAVAASAAPVKPRYVRQQLPPPTETRYLLRQLPDVSGGLVAMDPKTGRVYALVGGWSFQQSQFDRATQAKRQPGSAFKPFVYITALENGFTPASVVEDAPIELPQGPGQPPWRPANYEGTYAGPSTLEDALVHSRNLVTARLSTMIGLPAIAKTVQDFDVMDRMPLYYSMVLGAGETTLLRLTSAYAMLDNGGHWLLPSVVDVVQDRDGRIVYQKRTKGCAACFVAAAPGAGAAPNALYVVSGSPDPAGVGVPNARYADNSVLYKPSKPDPLVNPDADSEIIAMMQGVVQRGTGTVVASVGKPLAGKTGTTSDWFDAWFVGFSPDLVAGVYVGFDEPRTLGGGEVGGHVAAPIFRDFMAAALKDAPVKEFPPPPPGAMPGGAPMAALGNGYPDETPWGSGWPPAEQVTVLDGKAENPEAAPDRSQIPPAATPIAPDYRVPSKRANPASQAPAYAAAPPIGGKQAPSDDGSPPDRAYGRWQNPAYAAAPPQYGRAAPPDDGTSTDRRYERAPAPALAVAPRAYTAPGSAYGAPAAPYAAPASSYASPRSPGYPSPYGAPGYGAGTPGYGAPGPGYGYGYPAGSYGPRPGTGGLY